jgi:hypothetical protein
MTSQSAPPDVSIAKGFALTLETACEDFEILQRLVRMEIKLVSGNGSEDHRATSHARMALAKSFVFYVVRARRICEHGKGSLSVDRLERTRFLKATVDVLGVRNVNEHGFDISGNVSKPSLHRHTNESAILDETSMVVLGDQKILMGPLNLYDMYVPTDRMRKLAGFGTLRDSGSMNLPAAAGTTTGDDN